MFIYSPCRFKFFYVVFYTNLRKIYLMKLVALQLNQQSDFLIKIKIKVLQNL